MTALFWAENCLGALNLIDSTVSGFEPPAEFEFVTIVILLSPPTVDVALNVVAPLLSGPLQTIYSSEIILPSLNLLPSTPSPNITSYFPSSACSR